MAVAAFDVQTTVRNFSSRQLYAALACPGPSLLDGLVAWAEEEAGPALAGPVLAGPVLASPAVCGGEETTPAMSGPAVQATGEVTRAGTYGCTKPSTTVAVGGLGRA
jgi:hypothetical protein